MYRIGVADEFEKKYNKIDKSIQKEIDKEISQLSKNPFVGRPLSFKFFREKKIRSYRIYYLIYKEFLVIFLVSISSKSDQQLVINRIKDLIPKYYEEIKRKFI